MGLQDTSETRAFMLTLEGGPVSALLFDGGTGQRSEQERSHTYARATLWGDGFFLVESTRSRCMACSSLGSLRRRCVLFEGGQRERAPRSVKADVSRHCSPWRWGSLIGRRRSLETCWSSGSTSGSISQRPNAKGCTVLGTWRNLALFRLPGGSAGTESRALYGTRNDQCFWTTVDGDQLSLVADGAAADPRHLRREISAAIDQQLWTQAAQHEQGEGLHRGVDLYATRLHLARLRKRGQHKEANFLMACLTGALWPLQRQHDCFRSGETPIHPTCKRCEEGCAETFLHRHWLCVGNLFDHPNEAAKRAHQGLSRRAQAEAVDTPCLWLRGLLPADFTTGVAAAAGF